MRAELLVEADRVLAALPAARREGVREIVLDAIRRGALPPSGRAYIVRTTGSTFLADVLGAAIAEQARESSALSGPVPALEQDRLGS